MLIISTKKTKAQLSDDLEVMQQKIYEYEKSLNSYDQVVEAFTEGFVMDLYSSGTIKTVSIATLQSWFNNPDQNMEKITNLLTYYYIIDGNIFQLYDLIFSLPTLNYKIKTLKREEGYEEDIEKINYYLNKKVNHKELTRDLAVQLASKGTALGTWMGGKVNPYFHVFDNLKYIYPYGRSRGQMIGVIDLKWLKDMKEVERQSVYNNLSPLITQSKYDLYDKATGDTKESARYIELPPKKSFVGRIHTLSRNQRLGLPYGTQALLDIQHKQTMKDLEKSVAEKIIKAIALLKFKGKDDNDIKVKAGDKKQVFNSVKKVLQQNSSNDKGNRIAPYVEKSA